MSVISCLLRALGLLLASFLFQVGGPAYAAFYTFDELPLRQTPELRRAWNATAAISFQGDNSCTGAVISRDGYIATNLHCVATCIANSDLPIGSVLQTKAGGFFKYTKSLQQKFDNVSCRGYFLFQNPELANANLKLIWIGRGSAYFSDERVHEIPDLDFESMIEVNNDIAILKADGVGNNLSCIPLAKRKLELGEVVLSFGYPAETARPEGANSDGRNRFASLGQVVPMIQWDPFLLKILKLPEQWYRMMRFFNREPVMLANVDVMPGSSGSPLVNQRGEWLGTIHGGIHTSATQFTGASALAVSSQAFLNQLRQDLGDAQASAITDCPN